MTGGADPSRQLEDDALFYVWYKHLTALCLLTLGGVLSLSQLADAADIRKPLLIIVTGSVATAGVFAFSGAEQLVRGGISGSPLPIAVLLLQKSMPIILSFGVGAFLSIFVTSIY